MRNVDSTFDERKFGYSSIVDLLRAAGREGLFRVERDRQGVIRLFPGNVMQQPADEGEVMSAAPGSPRPWRPGDDIPDIHEADRPEPAEVVDGDVVQEIDTPEIIDARPETSGEQAAEAAGNTDERETGARKGRGRGPRAAKTVREPKAAKAPRARKTGTAAKTAKAPRAPRARKGTVAPAE